MGRKWTCFVPKHFRDAKKTSPFPTRLHCSPPCSVYKKRRDSETLGESQSRFQFILWAVSFAPIPLSTFDSCSPFQFSFSNAFPFRAQQCLHPARSAAQLLLCLLLVHSNASCLQDSFVSRKVHFRAWKKGLLLEGGLTSKLDSPPERKG